MNPWAFNVALLCHKSNTVLGPGQQSVQLMACDSWMESESFGFIVDRRAPAEKIVSNFCSGRIPGHQHR